MFLRQIDTHMPKKDAKSNFIFFTKINTEWTKKLNVRAKTIRLLEENTNLNLCYAN